MCPAKQTTLPASATKSTHAARNRSSHQGNELQGRTSRLYGPPCTLKTAHMQHTAARASLQTGARGAQAGLAALELLERVLGGRGAAVGQGHAQRLDRAGHGIGRVHAAARARARAGVAHQVEALRLADQVRRVRACAARSGMHQNRGARQEVPKPDVSLSRHNMHKHVRQGARSRGVVIVPGMRATGPDGY